MKKFFALVIIALISATLSACAPTSSNRIVTIGTPSLNGDFIAGFQNNAYDVYVRTMVWGYSTFTTTPAGEFVLDETVVKDLTVTTNDDGSKTYTYVIADNLVWSDGQALTAKDYVFALLFSASPQWRLIGTTDLTGRELVGYGAYSRGETTVFEGVKLISDTSFSVTIDASRLPYFFEVVYATVTPLPMHDWGQGAIAIGSDGQSLTGDLAVAAGFVGENRRNSPLVTSGPFKFDSYGDGQVKVVRNDLYVGDYRGHKPTIDGVIVRTIQTTIDVDLVIAGDVDIVGGVIEGAKIDRAKNSDRADVISYKRNGYGFISFTTDNGPVSDPLVRQAYIHLINREEFLTKVLEGYGAITNSEYGLAQWMYEAKKSELEARLNPYAFNIEAANDLLDQTEWVFERDGVTPWDRTKAGWGYWRHNAAGERLVHRHLGSTETLDSVAGVIVQEWPKGMNFAGVEFVFQVLDFSTMILYYVNSPSLGIPADQRTFHSFNLATNFATAFDPYFTYSSELNNPDGTVNHGINPTGLNDPELDRLMNAMRSLDPTQRDEYLGYWLEYQVRWNELLPRIPLYSNEYFDVFNVRVKGLVTTPFWTIARAMIDVSLD